MGWSVSELWACEVFDFLRSVGCCLLTMLQTTNFTIFCSHLMWQIVISATILSHGTTTFIVHQSRPANSTIVKKVVKFVVYLDRLIVLLMNVGPIILLFYFCYCNISIFGYLQELLISVGSLEFPAGKAEISDVSKCVGDVSFSSILYLYKLYGFLELEIYRASVISMFWVIIHFWYW